MLPIFVRTVLDKNQNQPLPNSKSAKLAAMQYQDTFGCICGYYFNSASAAHPASVIWDRRTLSVTRGTS
jgi:hypothetical protein